MVKSILFWFAIFVVAVPLFLCIVFSLFPLGSIGPVHFFTPFISIFAYLVPVIPAVRLASSTSEERPSYILPTILCIVAAILVAVVQMNMFILLTSLFGINDYALM